MDWGMANRMSQLIQPDGHCVFMPIDHGYFLGPTSKLEQPGKTVEPLLPGQPRLILCFGDKEYREDDLPYVVPALPRKGNPADISPNQQRSRGYTVSRFRISPE